MPTEDPLADPALLEEFEDYVFTFEQVAVVEWIRESDPKLFSRLRDLVVSGRLSAHDGCGDGQGAGRARRAMAPA